MTTIFSTMTFHWYGFLLGVGVVVTLLLVERAYWQWLERATGRTPVTPESAKSMKSVKSAKVSKLSAQSKVAHEAYFWRTVLWVVLGAGLGARVWHGVTDYWLYLDSPLELLAVWNGGLSILGALAGAAVVLAVLATSRGRLLSFWQWLDLAVLGIPAGQIIGRLGNAVNHELYGWPTRLPWGMAVPMSQRLPKVAAFRHFHPLFLYEIIWLLPFCLLSWRWFRRKPQTIGTGWLVLSYLLWYSVGRFWLDFIRISQTSFFDTGLGVNQVVLLGVIGLAAGELFRKTRSIKQKYVLMRIIIAGLAAAALFGLVSVSLFQYRQSFVGRLAVKTNAQVVAAERSATLSLTELQQVPDRAKVEVALLPGQSVGESMPEIKLQLEVVNQPQSLSLGLGGRDEIGSDGMLFVFDRSELRVFWMKGMQFDLDLIWIHQGQVVGVTPNVPAPQALQEILPRLVSPQPVDMVLEVPAGFAARERIAKGSRVQLLTIQPSDSLSENDMMIW